MPVEIGLSPLKTANGLLVLASIVDITERQAREQLQASLTETETLLKELHHRAKNNLQLIGSLLDLAAQQPGPDVIARRSPHRGGPSSSSIVYWCRPSAPERRACTRW